MNEYERAKLISERMKTLLQVDANGSGIVGTEAAVAAVLPEGITMAMIDQVQSFRNDLTAGFTDAASQLMTHHWTTNPQNNQIVAELPFGGDNIRFTGSLMDNNQIHWLQTYSVNGGAVMLRTSQELDDRAKAFASSVA